jgi:hypothetical protein
VNPNCIDVERIGDLSGLPEDHAARRHVKECPRCRSLWMSYQSFVKAAASPDADLEWARRQLAATIRRSAQEHPAGAPPSSRLSLRERWSVLLRPAPLVAAAALVVVAAVLWWRGGGPEAPVMRGGEAAGPGLVLNAAEVTATEIHFSWSAVPGADAYEVRLFDDGLDEVHHAGPVTAPEVVLDRSALPALAPGTSLTWRVLARRGGDVVETSSPASVTIP